MAYPSVTYTFVDADPLDASELNANFNDLVNSVVDGSKALNIEAITVADNFDLTSTIAITGASTISGTLNIGSTTALANDVVIDNLLTKILSITAEDRTLNSDAMTPLKSSVTVCGEGSLADDLETITATNFVDGSLLLLRKLATSGDITVKNGTGNIVCGSDRVLSTYSIMLLLYDAISTNWHLLSYESN